MGDQPLFEPRFKRDGRVKASQSLFPIISVQEIEVAAFPRNAALQQPLAAISPPGPGRADDARQKYG
jgi:hypothetical protein